MAYRLVCDCCEASYEPEVRLETFTIHHVLQHGIEKNTADYELCPDCARFVKELMKSKGIHNWLKVNGYEK